MSSTLSAKDAATLRSPLGATVQDYTELRTFLLRVAPPLTIVTAVVAWGAVRCWLAEGEEAGCSASVSLGLLTALVLLLALLVFVLYGVYRVLTWLPSIFEPPYVLFRVVRDPRSGREKGRQPLHPPATILRRPYAAGSGDNLRALWEEALTGSEADRASIVLRVAYSDRLGNNVFQYVYGRLRAAYLDIRFEAPPLGAPFAAVATAVHRWQPPGAGGAGSSEPRHELLLRPRACCASASTPAASDARAGTAGAAAAPACAACGDVTTLLRRVPGWSACWAGTLHAPSCRYIMNSRLLAGHEGVVAGWLRPGLHSELRRLGAGGAAGGAGAAPAGPEPARDPATTAPGPLLSFGPRDVAVHVRLGDILWGHHSAYRPLPMPFYRGALRRIAAAMEEGEGKGVGSDSGNGGGSGSNGGRAAGSEATPPAPAAATGTGGAPACGLPRPPFSRILLVTESFSHEVILRMAACLREEGWAEAVVVQSSSAAGDLLSLCCAPHLVLSISSYAWWPAFLGACRTIVAPRWGMLLPHLWRPSPAFPEALVQHDLSLPPAPPPEWAPAHTRGGGIPVEEAGASSGDGDCVGCSLLPGSAGVALNPLRKADTAAAMPMPASHVARGGGANARRACDCTLCAHVSALRLVVHARRLIPLQAASEGSAGAAGKPETATAGAGAADAGDSGLGHGTPNPWLQLEEGLREAASGGSKQPSKPAAAAAAVASAAPAGVAYPPPPQWKRVLEVPLPSLQRWAGKKREAFESLFAQGEL